MSLRNSFLFIIGLLALASCDEKRVFDQYKSFGKSWPKDSIATFEFSNQDTSKQYNLFINLRSNNDYPFNNIFLIVMTEAPNGMTKVDTLEYQMANPDGTLMGEGFSDVKESKLFFKEKYKFDTIGNYKIKIQQAMRQTGKINGVKELAGITEIGFRAEKIK
ncbi:MAG TPA: gliding motility lipoprotein GldH [Flavobacterium sp.]|nr:gliding motility lipoprotein GldH [Flavobacterium sp.]